MKAALVLFAAAVVALLGGCTTPSLNALATAETTVTDAELVGTWIDAKKEDKSQYIVTDAGQNTYHLKVAPKEQGKAALEFSFQVCKLADSRFIDMTVTKGDADSIGEKWGNVVVPAHVFMKMKRTRDQLQVWQVKDQWLKDGLRSGELKLAHATIKKPGEDDGALVLTGSTEELQGFFRKNVDSEELFDTPMTFKRDTGEQATEKAAPVEKKK